MKRFLNPRILVRILIPFALIAISGISARSHEAAEALRQANLSVGANDPAAAANWLARAAQQLPYRADLWESAGHQAVLAGNPGEAIEYFRAAANLNNLSPQGQVALGEAYQQNDDLSVAIQVWESSLAQDDFDSQAYWLLAMAQRQTGNYEAAIENLRAFTLLEPGNAAAQYELGLLLAATEPRAASVHLVLAGQLDNQYAERVAILQSALRSAQFDNPPAYIFTLAGQALGALDEWQLARRAFLRATEQDPTYAEAWAYLGEAYQHTGAGGFTELEVAWALDPDSLAANSLLSLYWQRQNQMDEALFYLENAARLEPSNLALQADLGALHLRLGDLDEALARYQRATELSPNNPRYWILLATFSVEHEVFLEQAGLPAAQRVLELAPEDPASLVLLGQVHFLLQNYESSADYLMQALAIHPDYPPAHLHLGLLFITLGDLESGRDEFLRVVELDGDGQFGKYALQLLAQHFP